MKSLNNILVENIETYSGRRRWLWFALEHNQWISSMTSMSHRKMKKWIHSYNIISFLSFHSEDHAASWLLCGVCTTTFHKTPGASHQSCLTWFTWRRVTAPCRPVCVQLTSWGVLQTHGEEQTHEQQQGTRKKRRKKITTENDLKHCGQKGVVWK